MSWCLSTSSSSHGSFANMQTQWSISSRKWNVKLCLERAHTRGSALMTLPEVLQWPAGHCSFVNICERTLPGQFLIRAFELSRFANCNSHVLCPHVNTHWSPILSTLSTQMNPFEKLALVCGWAAEHVVMQFRAETSCVPQTIMNSFIQFRWTNFWTFLRDLLR